MFMPTSRWKLCVSFQLQPLAQLQVEHAERLVEEERRRGGRPPPLQRDALCCPPES